MDENLKKEINFRLEALGLSFNTFVVMAGKQLVAQNELPFTTKVPVSYVPTAETAAAMEHAYKAMTGEIPDDAVHFSSAAEMINFLEREED
jgi:antitoxin component of RelBE/YafQ-DinJ toxin-antitoxin module